MPDGRNVEAEVSPKAAPRKGIRWWPAFLILLLATVAAFWARSTYGGHRQDQNIAFANIVIVAFLLLIIWCILLSRLKGRTRWGIVGTALGLIALGAVLFRFQGVTGDLVPVLEPRWNHRTLAPINTGNQSASHKPPSISNEPTNN